MGPDTVHLYTWGSLKGHLDPFRIFALFESVTLAVNFNICRRIVSDNCSERKFQYSIISPERILWTDKFCIYSINFSADIKSFATSLFDRIIVSSRIKRKHTLGAAQVRHTHGRKLHATEFFRRKCNGDTEHIAEDPVLAKGFPKWFAFPEESNVGLAQRNPIFAQADLSLRSSNVH